MAILNSGCRCTSCIIGGAFLQKVAVILPIFFRSNPCSAICMARPLRLHVPGMIYHVTARGNAQQTIFEDTYDYNRFLELLGIVSRRFTIECLGYCLLGNHYHLLLKPGELPISRMMQQLNSRYCQGFNRRHKRVGHVLQGRYKATLVESPDYLFNVVRYVVMNPVRANLVNDPAAWRWSSYRATAGLEPCPEFLHLAPVWGAFGAPDAATGQQRFVEHVCSPSDVPMPERVLILGSRAFVERFTPMLQPTRNVEAFVLAERFIDRPPLADLIGELTHRRALAVAARRAFDEYAYTLSEIGRHVGRSGGTVWSWVHRLARPVPAT